MSPRYREARWYYEPSTASLRRTKAGEREGCIAPEVDMEIPFDQIPALIEALEQNGLLRPRLDERLRTEDLKITHRLMDWLGQAIGK